MNMIRNLLIGPQIYPGYKFKIYHDNTVPDNVIACIKSFDNVDCCINVCADNGSLYVGKAAMP